MQSKGQSMGTVDMKFRRQLVLAGIAVLVLLAALAVGLRADVSVAQSWEHVIDQGRIDFAADVAVSGEMMIGTQVSQGVGSATNLIVRGTDVDSGAEVWSSTIAGGQATAFVATDGGLAFVLGMVPANVGPAGSTQFIVRAYDASSGQVQWTQMWNYGAGHDNYPWWIHAQGGVVAAVGIGGNQIPGQFVKGVVQSMDALTGEVLWSHVESNPNGDEQYWSVQTDGSRVVTSGYRSVGFDQRTVLTTYDAHSGVQLWRVERSFVVGMAKLMDGRVVATGMDMSETASPRTYLEAWNAASGAQLWKAQSHPGYYSTIAMGTSRIVGAGPGGVQSVSPVNGGQHWFHQAPEGEEYVSTYTRAVVTDNGTYLGGRVVGWSGDGYAEWMLRVYGNDGSLMADMHPHHVTGQRQSWVNGIAISGSYLAVAGNADGESADAIFAGYDASAIEGSAHFESVNPYLLQQPEFVFTGIPVTLGVVFKALGISALP